MIGGLLKSTSRLAIMAATGMFVGGLALTPAQAADLGGDCCADLEERVADLEATTARKGNRKVSLKISGHVNRSIGWLEDGDGESEFYSAGSGISGSRVQFSGGAKLTSNVKISYTLRLRMSDNTSAITVPGQNDGSDNVSFDRNVVALTHSQIGTVAIGRTGAPTDGVANISLAGRGVTGDSEGDNGWNDFAGYAASDLENGTGSAIAYISPNLAGFTLAAAWIDADDPTSVTDSDSGVDIWDIALRYAGEFGPIRLAAGIGYTTTDSDDLFNGNDVDGANVMGSIALMHTPTGLNVAFAAGKEMDGGLGSNSGASLDSNGDGDTADFGEANDTFDAQFWHVEGGISQNFFGPGNTSIYGEYGNYDDDGAGGAAADDTTVMWGMGIVQNFDSAATELYIAYRNWDDDDITDGDVQQVLAGARIKF